MDEIKSLMDQSIDNIREELWALGDSIYDNPEVALHEVFASTLLEDWLEQRNQRLGHDEYCFPCYL